MASGRKPVKGSVAVGMVGRLGRRSVTSIVATRVPHDKPRNVGQPAESRGHRGASRTCRVGIGTDVAGSGLPGPSGRRLSVGVWPIVRAGTAMAESEPESGLPGRLGTHSELGARAGHTLIDPSGPRVQVLPSAAERDGVAAGRLPGTRPETLGPGRFQKPACSSASHPGVAQTEVQPQVMRTDDVSDRPVSAAPGSARRCSSRSRSPLGETRRAWSGCVRRGCSPSSVRSGANRRSRRWSAPGR